jgi:hypothetical protein
VLSGGDLPEGWVPELPSGDLGQGSEDWVGSGYVYAPTQAPNDDQYPLICKFVKITGVPVPVFVFSLGVPVLVDSGGGLLNFGGATPFELGTGTRVGATSAYLLDGVDYISAPWEAPPS